MMQDYVILTEGYPVVKIGYCLINGEGKMVEVTNITDVMYNGFTVVVNFDCKYVEMDSE